MITKILIVEDEILIAEDLAAALEDYGYVVSDIAISAAEALESIKKQPPHLVLLDIQLKGDKSGIELAHDINDTYALPLIFLTSNADRATLSKALETFPKAFLSKPFNEKDLANAIEVALQSTRLDSHTSTSSQPIEIPEAIFVKDKDRFRKVPLEDILFVEADGSYCKLHTKTAEFVLTMNTQQFLNAVSTAGFVRVHRSYIVNANEVQEFDNHYVFFGDKHVPISKTGQKELLSVLNKL